MYFRRWCYLLLAYPGSLLAEVPQEVTALSAIPNTCVALREGRHCYTEVVLSWQQPTIGNYCLRDATSKYIMQCWLKQQHGVFNYAFDSEQSLSFELFDSNTAKVIATTEVKLQWVYQNRQKKRRWRLF
ncbi:MULTISPECIES: DUF3019 domain-containing protein [Pseudoalteromonas]|jgi:hypothetical protein|uniref:DUF3019 domain-containing protein n=2 Tax=Pseudoalteromonas TaxID=53246 RepID=A0AAC9UEV8_9GAMM|nr:MULTISPECIES: DUF3019 domain-containing protein [Pseudoalteromonas]ASM53265.1 hypothetical protein PNIG_a1039 [Pseudoalteromonas nigrifaciens]MBB1369786.1 DUF3019 domain-containing protein [Pseudoalteromonas sp. SR45-4]MBB1405931.1 DUF3019 domain-containing protein [Pseudoalteromonas sp. SG44-5]MBE0421713.1 DUF3019 domain-containing protein [Pseudoalteromonas nigrifaciens]MBH0070985.1 DUF3019 domain-containing protein [Pseudoalteromonas sp. NZS127]|tara:strand:- start:4161 stop:4547 length:387 start_codon:yes stop_codon:yes gene_type:complete